MSFAQRFVPGPSAKEQPTGRFVVRTEDEGQTTQNAVLRCSSFVFHLRPQNEG